MDQTSRGSKKLLRLPAFAFSLSFGLAFTQLADAVEAVQFNSAATPPTAFQINRAKAKGEVAKTKPGDELKGTRRIPAGNGPFPAVVMIHGCRGVLPFLDNWAEYLADLGVATLIVDSYSTRDLNDECNNIHGSQDQSSDAYGALEYLAGIDRIDAERIGLLGWGQSPVVGIMETDGVEQFFTAKFWAAVGLYVNCGYFTQGMVYAPTLLVVAGKDDWSKTGRCADSVTAGRKNGSPIFLVEYPDALHSFDDPDTGDETRLEVRNPYKNPPIGATLGYNRDAHEDAVRRVGQFLVEHLSVR
jgi:dienelactone hydrolase